MVFGLTDWAEYDVDVEEADSFRLSLRYATFVLPDEIAFDAGVSTVRISSTWTGSFSLDALSFTREWTGPVPGVPWPVPGTIEVAATDTYGIEVRYATTFAGKSVSLLCDGAPITGSVALAPSP